MEEAGLETCSGFGKGIPRKAFAGSCKEFAGREPGSFVPG